MGLKINPQLIEDCCRSNRAAQRRLYELLMPYLSGVCRRYLRNQSDLSDALQESFINVFRYIERYDKTRAEFHTWATRIAINCSLKINRKMYKVESVEYGGFHEEEAHIPSVLDKMDDEALMTYLKKMPAEFYEVFNLHAVDGYSHKEISEQLDIHESLSRQRLSRARKWIRERVAEDVLPQRTRNRS